MSCNFSLLQDPTKVTGSMFLGAIHPERSFRMWPCPYWLRLKPILDHHRRLNLHMFGWKHQNLCKFDFFQVVFQFMLRFTDLIAKLSPWLSAGYCETNSRPGFCDWTRPIWLNCSMWRIEFWKFTKKLQYCYIMCYPCWINTKFHASLIARLTSTPLFVSWDQASAASQHHSTRKLKLCQLPERFLKYVFTFQVSRQDFHRTLQLPSCSPQCNSELCVDFSISDLI